MFSKFLFFCMFISFFSIISQEKIYEFPSAIKEKREEIKKEMLENISSEILTFSNTKDENSIKKSLESMQVLNYLELDGFEFLKLALKNYPKNSESFNDRILETIYTLYASGFEDDMQKILEQSLNSKHFIIALHFLIRLYPENEKLYLNTLKKKYPDYKKKPNLNITATYLNTSPIELLKARPPLKDLLTHSYGEKKYIIFSFQRANRDFPGLAVIRKPDGKFLRREDGSFFSISQLARSISNLPSYVVNGNTPQGIYSIQSIQEVKSEVIGPTPALITALPFEVSTSKFFHSKINQSWNLNSYINLLPVSWRGYKPIQEAYIAGEIGRRGIYAHGTTIDTDFFMEDSFYPNTPTRGCLSAKEIWSKKTGMSIYSDQLILLKAINSLGKVNGFLIVFELDNKEMPVSLDEILLDILEVEEGR